MSLKYKEDKYYAQVKIETEDTKLRPEDLPEKLMYIETRIHNSE